MVKFENNDYTDNHATYQEHSSGVVSNCRKAVIFYLDVVDKNKLDKKTRSFSLFGGTVVGFTKDNSLFLCQYS